MPIHETPENYQQTRMAQVQRVFDEVHPNIADYSLMALVSYVLKISTQMGLSYKSFQIVEKYYINKWTQS